MNKFNALAALSFLVVSSAVFAYTVDVTNNTGHTYKIYIRTTDLIKKDYSVSVDANGSADVSTAGYCLDYMTIRNTTSGEPARRHTFRGSTCRGYSITIFPSGNTWNFVVE